MQEEELEMVCGRYLSEHENKSSYCLSSTNVLNGEKITKNIFYSFYLRSDIIKIFTIFSPSCITCSSSSVKKPALRKACAYA
jgi:hypothetical protein